MEFFNRYKRYFILGGCFILLGVFVYLYMANKDDLVSDQENETLIADITTTTEKVVQNKIFVDVKGAVNKPGVYEFNEGDKVIDAIKKADGLTKSAVTPIKEGFPSNFFKVLSSTPLGLIIFKG